MNELGKGQFDIVVPSVSVRAEPPVALVDANVDRKGTRQVAEAYLKYLYTRPAQEIIAQFRRDAEALTGAVQILNESTQKNLRDLANLARSNAEHVLKASKEIMNHSSPENAASKQADFARSWFDTNTNGARK